MGSWLLVALALWQWSFPQLSSEPSRTAIHPTTFSTFRLWNGLMMHPGAAYSHARRLRPSHWISAPLWRGASPSVAARRRLTAVPRPLQQRRPPPPPPPPPSPPPAPPDQRRPPARLCREFILDALTAREHGYFAATSPHGSPVTGPEPDAPLAFDRMMGEGDYREVTAGEGTARCRSNDNAVGPETWRPRRALAASRLVGVSARSSHARSRRAPRREGGGAGSDSVLCASTAAHRPHRAPSADRTRARPCATSTRARRTPGARRARSFCFCCFGAPPSEVLVGGGAGAHTSLTTRFEPGGD